MSASVTPLAADRPLSLREAAESPVKRDLHEGLPSNIWEESTRGFDFTKPLQPKLEFGHDLKGAIEQSQASGKPIVLLLTSKDCAWCDALDKEMGDPKLKDLQNRAIFLKLDVDDDPKSPGRIMFNALGAKGFPTTSVFNVDASGAIKETKRLNGYYSSNELKTAFNEVLPGQRVLLAENKANKRNA